MTSKTPSFGVAFVPCLDDLTSNPYWAILASALSREGAVVLPRNPGTLRIRWLWANRGSIDVLHLHYIQSHYVVEARHARFRWVLRFARNIMIARMLGYRIVWTVHDETPAFPLRPKWVEDLAYQLVARLAHAVIVHCTYAKQMVRRRYGRTSGVVIVDHPPLVNLYPSPAFTDSLRERLGIPTDSIVFLCFGQIRPNKGIERLLDAFSQLEDSTLRLIVAGAPGPDSDYVTRLRQAATQDARVLLMDQLIPDEHVFGLFAEANVAVMSFAQVLTSSSVILAMSLGKPVIAPASGCIPELLSSEMGWTYPPEDTLALQAALRAATDADLATMGSRALHRASQMQISSTVSQTLLAYGRRS